MYFTYDFQGFLVNKSGTHLNKGLSLIHRWCFSMSKIITRHPTCHWCCSFKHRPNRKQKQKITNGISAAAKYTHVKYTRADLKEMPQIFYRALVKDSCHMLATSFLNLYNEIWNQTLKLKLTLYTASWHICSHIFPQPLYCCKTLWCWLSQSVDPFLPIMCKFKSLKIWSTRQECRNAAQNICLKYVYEILT